MRFVFAKEVISVDASIILDKINKDSFTRRDVFDAASSACDDFKESDMRNLMEALLVGGSIVRIAHNRYVRKESSKQEYKPVYSDEAKKLIKDVKEKYPYLSFQVWEITWFNEFLNHLVAHNRIFLDTIIEFYVHMNMSLN